MKTSRMAANAASCSRGRASSRRIIVGTVKNTFGRQRATFAAIASGAGQLSSMTIVLPQESGPVKPLSSAYAKKSFEVASTTVSSPAWTTSRRSLPACAQLAWLWMIAFGRPVVPEEYSQNAGSSARVVAVACSGRAVATAAASDSSPRAGTSRVAVPWHAARPAARCSGSAITSRASQSPTM